MFKVSLPITKISIFKSTYSLFKNSEEFKNVKMLLVTQDL